MQTHWTCPNGITHQAGDLRERSRHRTSTGIVSYHECPCGHVVMDFIRWEAVSTAIAARVGVGALRRPARNPAA